MGNGESKKRFSAIVKKKKIKVMQKGRERGGEIKEIFGKSGA